MGEPRGGDETASSDAAHAGLCASCRHARVQRSAKGSAFWRCARADREPTFRRYPPLPVRSCAGHERGEVG